MKLAGLLLVCGFVLASCQTSSTVEDPAATHFIKFYGRDGDQEGRDLAVLPDGSMVLFGTTKPTADTSHVRWYVVKVDAKGTIIWDREFGGSGDREARDIEVMTSGDLVLVGNTYPSAMATTRDVLVMILSVATGTVVNSAVVSTSDIGTGAPSPGDEDASTITQISDGGFIISGTTSYVNPGNPNPNFPVVATPDSHDAMKIRLNADLTTYPNTWKQIYGRFADDGSVRVMEIPGGPSGNFYYYAIGYTNLNGNNAVGYDYLLTPLGANGDPASDLFFLGTSSEEKMSSFVYTGSQLVMGGQQVSTGTDVYIASTFNLVDTTGFGNWYLPVQFEKNLSLNLGSNLGGHTSVCQAIVNGGFFILADENGFNNNQNWILTRLNNNGSVAWNAPIVFGGEGFDSAGAVKELPDGRVVIIGTMRTGRFDVGELKMTLVKVSGEGKFE